MQDELRKAAEEASVNVRKLEKQIMTLFSKGYVPDFAKVEKLYKERDYLIRLQWDLFALLNKAELNY